MIDSPCAICYPSRQLASHSRAHHLPSELPRRYPHTIHTIANKLPACLPACLAVVSFVESAFAMLLLRHDASPNLTGCCGGVACLYAVFDRTHSMYVIIVRIASLARRTTASL